MRTPLSARTGARHAASPPGPARRRRHAGGLAGALVGLAVSAWAPARPAAAQYKNIAFGFDVAYDGLIRPGIYDSAGNIIGVGNDGTTPSNFPLRLSQGARIGLESGFKLHSDHWWANFRLNFHLLSIGSSTGDPSTVAFDKLASNGIGTILGLQPVVGIRRYFLTDRVRPYLQASLAYMRLFNYNDPQTCTATTLSTGQTDTSKNIFCDTSGRYLFSYLTHQNIVSLQATPAVEIVFSRDVALTLSLGIEYWFIFNAQDNWNFSPALGVTIYG